VGDEGRIETSFDLEEGRVVDEVRRRRARVVGIQLPEGLKRHASALASLIESRTGAVVVVSADPCYGACDLAEDAFAPLGVELVVHYGHDGLGDVEPRIPTVFVEARARLDPVPALRAALPLLPEGGRVGLLATAQHRDALDAAREALGAAGMTAVVGQGGRRLAFPGQVLGCDLSAARAVGGEVDAFLVLGGGNFHAAGVALATGRPVVVADVESGTARRADGARDATLRSRAAAIARARDARTFGILVGSKPGQRRWELALRLREQLLAAGRAPVLLSARELSPERMLALGLDAYVSTMCPRIAVDDQAAYPRPILTPQEARIALGLEPWEHYRLDEIG
jgi:2-(3-amino-3-carboxypropyl)histidine synthase